MSVDYYSRIERQRGPQPSEQMVASIAQGLHLSRAERDHLYLLAGHPAPARGSGTDHVGPGMLRVFDRLVRHACRDRQRARARRCGRTRWAPRSTVTPPYVGPARSIGYRWFTEAAARELVPPEEHGFYSRLYVSGLRGVVALRGPVSPAAHLADLLLASNEEFRRLWDTHEVDVRPREVKRFLHPEVGPLELSCQVLLDPDVSHMLLVYTAVPGSESHDRLALLSVLAAPPG